MGPQLNSAVRTQLGNAQAKLESRAETLAQNKGQLSQQALSAVQGGVGAATSKVNSEIQSRTENKASLDSQIQSLRADNRPAGGGTGQARDQDRPVEALRRELVADRLRLRRLKLLVQQLRARLDQLGPR